MSRRQVIGHGALAAGTLCGIGASSELIRAASARAADDDIQTLNTLLELERVELAYFERGLQNLELGGKRALIAKLEDQERSHVDALAAMVEDLGGDPEPEIKYTFSFVGVQGYLQMGREIQDVVLRAYSGLIPLLGTEESRSLALSIAQVEGQHSAILRLETGEAPSPEALISPHSEYEALSSVLRFTGQAIYE